MLIGLCGYKGSGKDTVADILVKDYGFVKKSFAEPLKEGLKSLFDLSDEQLHDSEQKELLDQRWNRTPRQLMQWLATDVLRTQFDENFFVKHLDSRLPSGCDDNKIVISDVRFVNEAEMLKSRGGIIVRINRDVSHDDKHQSEYEFTKIKSDFKINNDYDMNHLEFSVKNLLYHFGYI